MKEALQNQPPFALSLSKPLVALVQPFDRLRANGGRSLLLLGAVLLFSCAHRAQEEDPLKNTKRLIAEGHATLYNNGAFAVPMTTIYLIPPGPESAQLVAEMAGLRAAQSFRTSLQHARESLDFAQAGIGASLQAGKAVQGATGEVAGQARALTKEGSALAASAPTIAASVADTTQEAASATHEKIAQGGAALSERAQDAGQQISSGSEAASQATFGATRAGAGKVSEVSLAASGKHARQAQDRFVMGYAALPGKLSARAGGVSQSASLQSFITAFQRSNEWRAKASDDMAANLSETQQSYSSEAAKPFTKAREELGTGAQSGYTFAAIKSLRWVLQGLLWDASLKPVGKMGAATLGYVAINAVVFPAMVTFHEGAAVTNIAVQVAWNSVAGAYEIAAPSGEAALAGLLSAGELVAGQAAAGATLAGGAAVSGATYLGGKAAAGTVAAAGYGAGKGVQYVAAPLATLGVAAGTVAAGTVATTAAAASGAALVVVGTAGEATTQVIGTGAAGATVAIGTTGSVVAGTALGAYELGKAVALPAGYEVGAGIVLSYDTLAQLSAQTLLAASDAAYLVLSLEGPRWVIYAVKGSSNDGEALLSGAVLNLRSMQQEGETFYRVPASEEETRRIVEATQQQIGTTITAPPAVTDTP